MEQLAKIIELARRRPDIAALWLYGSRARGDHHAASDYDFGVVFTSWLPDALSRRLRPEEVAIDWQHRLAMPEGSISVVDLAIAPIPLGWNVLDQGKLLLDQFPAHRMQAEQRIYSMWELDLFMPTKPEGCMNNTGPNAYLNAQKEHVDQCELDLAELKRRLQQGPWSRFEQRAAERTLQVLIESCIGLAKHWARKETGMASNEALTAFNRLAEKGVIDKNTPWRKVIGLRNALVHDYLEVDPAIVHDVVLSGYHQALLDFARQGIKALG
ncbi:type VII toxin-antitoxin system HepT family RNase toxin [Zobellella sp. An-6]|uniref:type VII toxin-antitoxin system HepT family RNase toxin n=1 Tax=Zobellella sp. An-6 TaxID=3400218 RepID=UPI00404385DA